MASRAPALRRRESQWAGLGRAADGVGGRSGVGCDAMLWTGGRRNRPTSSRRKEEPSVASPCRIRGEKERSSRFPNPDVSHPPPHEPTHTYGLPLHELTSTSTSTSTFALLRAIFAPVAASHHPFRVVLFAPSLAARSTRTVLPDAIPGLSSSSLLLVLSSGVVAFPAPALARRSHSSCTTNGWELFLRSERRTENGGPGLSGDGRSCLVYMT